MRILENLKITLSNLSATGSYKYEELLNNGFVPTITDDDHGGVIDDENTLLVRSTRRHSQGRRKSTVLSPMVISEDCGEGEEEEDTSTFSIINLTEGDT